MHTVTGPMSLQISDGTSSLDPREWDRLASTCGIYSSAAWLRAWEVHAESTPTIVSVRDACGTLLAAIPCFRGRSGEGNQRYDISALFADLPEGPPPAGEQIVAGGSAGYVGGVLIESELSAGQRREAMRLLMHGIDTLRRRWGCSSGALMYLDRAAAAEFAESDPSLACLATTVSVRMAVPWSDFDEYLASLSSSRRSNARRDIRRFESAGYEVRVDRLSPWIDRIAPLLANVQGQHGFSDSVEGAASYLRSCAAEGLDDYTVVFLATRGQDVAGFALAYDFGGVLSMRTVGLDYAASHDSGVYFSAYVYAPIRYALAHQLQEIDFGLEAHTAKLRKGGQATVLWSLVALPEADPIRSRDLEAGWNSTQAREWNERLAGMPSLPTTEDWSAPAAAGQVPG